MAIEDRIKNIKAKISAISSKAELIAVSKQRSGVEIVDAIKAGQRIFGENRVQEAKSKWPEIKKEYPSIELHLIGHLQTNKVREALDIFDVIEILDSKKLADCFLKEMQKIKKNPAFYIQVNIGKESQKSGILPEETDEFINYCKTIGLNIIGLMCIPPADDEPSIYFKNLAIIAKRNGLKNLSMGMSADFEEAIKCGSTHVRIGTAIFGDRE